VGDDHVTLEIDLKLEHTYWGLGSLKLAFGLGVQAFPLDFGLFWRSGVPT